MADDRKWPKTPKFGLFLAKNHKDFFIFSLFVITEAGLLIWGIPELHICSILNWAIILFQGKSTCRPSIVNWREFSYSDSWSQKRNTPIESFKSEIWDYEFSGLAQNNRKITAKFISSIFQVPILSASYFLLYKKLGELSSGN